MDRHPQPVFPPTQQLPLQLRSRSNVTRGERPAPASPREVLSSSRTTQAHPSAFDLSGGSNRSNLFRPSQKNSGDACCCEMSANVPPIHLAECEECVQSCDDPGCTIELTPQCTEQCVVVCNDPHHSLGSCVDDSSRSFPCSDGLGCSDIDDFVCTSF